ncbi:MAG: LpqN/LpqT family lipoprotein [Mycobacterium sp.]
MRTRSALAAILAVAAMSACSPDTPDYQSIWETSTTAAATPTQTEGAAPISVYLEQNGVIGSPMTPETLTGITVTMPRPEGWQVVTDPALRDTFQVLRKPVDAGYVPQASLFVMKLTGDFEVAEAIQHGKVGAQLSEGFTELDASTEDFNGFPSSMIECSYTLAGQRLHQYQRIVIPTNAPPAAERFLVQFTVTTAADQAVDHAADVETLIDGFKVTVP